MIVMIMGTVGRQDVTIHLVVVEGGHQDVSIHLVVVVEEVLEEIDLTLLMEEEAQREGIKPVCGWLEMTCLALLTKKNIVITEMTILQRFCLMTNYDSMCLFILCMPRNEVKLAMYATFVI